MARYAVDTEVSSDRSRAEIERTVECGALLDPIECLFLIQRIYSDWEWKYQAIRAHEKKEREKRLKEQARRDARKQGTSGDGRGGADALCDRD